MGYDSSLLNKLNLGPILFKEECSFIKELHPDDTISINILKGEIKDDGSRWVLHHEIFNGKREKSAHISTKGAWIDLEKRKLTIPPKDLADALLELPEGVDYIYKKSS